MVSVVVKSDGTKEPFDIEKLKKSIGAAARDAGLESGRTSELITQVSAAVFQLVSHNDEVKSGELKEKVLEELSKVEPSVVAAWKKYDRREKSPFKLIFKLFGR